MTEGLLNQDEKQFIWLYVDEAKSPKEKRSRIAGMASEFGIDTTTVTRVIDEVKESIRTEVATLIGEDAKRKKRKEIATRMGTTLPRISAITAWTTIRINRGIQNEELLVKPETSDSSDISKLREGTALNNANDNFEQNADFSDGDGGEDVLIDSNKGVIKTGMGEYTDYKTETKEKWRQKWKEFIANNTIPEERKLMRVLCLPGIECLEIPLYLELGFLPHNIVGVEGGEEAARREFSLKAAQYGIEPRLGRLEDILPQENSRYDVVSFDFLGPLCDQYIQIARHTLLGPKALMLTNFMGKREQKGIQRALRTVEIRTTQPFKLVERGIEAILDSSAMARAELDAGEMDLRSARNNASILTFLSNIGLHRQENWTFSQNLENFPIHPKVVSKADEELSGFPEIDRKYFMIGTSIDILYTTIAKSFALFFQVYSVPKEQAESLVERAYSLISHIGFGISRPTKIESYRYKSTAGKTKSPFESDFVVLETPLEKYREFRKTIDFFTDFLAEFSRIICGGSTEFPNFYLRNKNSALMEPGMRMTTSDTISIEHPHRTVAQIRVKKLVSDVERSIALNERNITRKIAKDGGISRMHIE